jgi:hypothetical protein
MKCSSKKCFFQARYKCQRCHRHVCSIECQQRLGCSTTECLGLELDDLPSETLAQILRHSDASTQDQVRLTSTRLRGIQDYALKNKRSVTVRSLAELKSVLKWLHDHATVEFIDNLTITFKSTFGGEFDRLYMSRIEQRYGSLLERLRERIIWKPLEIPSDQDVQIMDPHALELVTDGDATPLSKISWGALLHLHTLTVRPAPGIRHVIGTGLAISKFINRTSTNLRTLSMPLMNVRSSGAIAIAQGKSPITKLDLSANEILPDGFIALAQSSLRLTDLNLSHNDPRRAGIIALLHSTQPLATLNLSGSRFHGMEAQDLTAITLPLTSFMMASCDLNSELTQALAQNRLALRRLDLQLNVIGNDGVVALAQSEWPLTDLNLDRNQITLDGALALAHSKLPLSILKMAYNRIGMAGASALIESALPLVSLDITENVISIEDKTQLYAQTRIKNLAL